MSTKKDERIRDWAMILYPESLPADWKDRLIDHHLTWILSPLHDKDVNPSHPDPSDPDHLKKSHYHIIFRFEGKKSYSQMKDLQESIFENGSAPLIEKVNSLRSYCRYLCHLDNPEKAQYDVDQVLCYGGENYFDIIGSASDYDRELSLMRQYISSHTIVSYRVFCDVCDREFPNWSHLLNTRCSNLILQYVKSLDHDLFGGKHSC